ncbi:MAG: hypothetical protein ACTSQJ_02210 [Promethearchaeota archaeon]
MNNKALLEKLQAEMTLRLGKKISQQKILDKSIEFVYKFFNDFIKEVIEPPKITEDLIERLKKNAYKGPLYHQNKHDDELLYGMKREQ